MSAFRGKADSEVRTPCLLMTQSRHWLRHGGISPRRGSLVARAESSFNGPARRPLGSLHTDQTVRVAPLLQFRKPRHICRDYSCPSLNYKKRWGVRPTACVPVSVCTLPIISCRTLTSCPGNPLLFSYRTRSNCPAGSSCKIHSNCLGNP